MLSTVVMAAILLASQLQTIHVQQGAYVTTILVSDSEGGSRRALIRFKPNVGWWFVVEVRRQIGGTRRPVAGGIIINACGRQISREGLVAASMINAETDGIGTELLPDEVQQIIQCRQANVSIDGIDVVLDAKVASRMRIMASARSNFPSRRD